jgi:hypothetical protein
MAIDFIHYVSDEPMELDITPPGIQRINSEAFADVATRLAQVVGNATRIDPKAESFISSCVGVRIDLNKPHVRMYYNRTSEDTDEEIEAGRLAVAHALEELK